MLERWQYWCPPIFIAMSSQPGAAIPTAILETLATEALRKLGVAVQPGAAARDYTGGRTAQLPGTFVVNTRKRRIRRVIEMCGGPVLYGCRAAQSKAAS